MSNDENFFKFSITFKCSLHSVNIYHLMITRKNNLQCYSFYFRYNTLLQMHDYAKTNPQYSKILSFPPKNKLFGGNKIVREKEFQIYFDFLLSESDLNSNLGNILELFGLNSHFSLIFTSATINGPLLLKNPFKVKEELNECSDNSLECYKQGKINLHLNG